MIFTYKQAFLSLIFLWLAATAFSQSPEKNIYSGGMLIYQPGYAFTENIHQEIRDASSGLGGILRFYFAGNITAGIYGGSQKIHYTSAGSDNSYLSLGYGGPFIGISHKNGKVRYTVSAFAGGGTVRNLHIESQDGDVLEEAYLYKHSAFVTSPILSIDYAMTRKISFTLQTVCLVSRFEGDWKMVNPVFQLGVLFSR